MLSSAVKELENKLLNLHNISYDSIDNLMRKIMKTHNLTAKELHNAFKNKYKKTPDDWIKEKMKKIQEDHKEIASGKKLDDEGYMAKNELDTIERQIKNLRKVIKSGNTQLPAWVQSKITKASDYIDTAAEYLQSDETVDESLGYKKSDLNPISKGKTPKASATQISRSTGAGALTSTAAAELGPTAQKLQKNKAKQVDIPSFVKIQKEGISLVEKILGEEKCGKGMYWCNTDKECKPLPEGMKVPGQKIKPTEVGIGKEVDESCNHTKKGKNCPVHGIKECPVSEEKNPKGPTQPYKSPEEISKKHGVSLKNIQKQIEIGTKIESEHTSDERMARITALQHIDELPDYYTRLKKMETQKESSIIRDLNGNYYAEFIDIIRSGSIEEENPCWNGKKVPNSVKESENIEEATRMPAQTGNNVFVTLSWRGKYYTIQIFFPQAKVPSRLEISDEIQKIYPGSMVVTYRVADFKPGDPLIYAYKGGSGGKLGPNKNYVKPMGEEVEISEAKKSEMPCNKPKAEAHGSGETGKSHVVKACEGGKEKLIRFGQLGVKGSPKKKGESKQYAMRRHMFQTRHAKNIAKGKMSAAYWANKVKW